MSVQEQNDVLIQAAVEHATQEALEMVLASSNPHVEILGFFRFAHLPPHLRANSCLFAELAVKLAVIEPSNTERGVALRKLLEAKDAAVRSVLAK